MAARREQTQSSVRILAVLVYPVKAIRAEIDQAQLCKLPLAVAARERQQQMFLRTGCQQPAELVLRRLLAAYPFFMPVVVVVGLHRRAALEDWVAVVRERP